MSATSTSRVTLEVLYAIAAGALFGVGLVVSGMSQPEKVLGFLDVLGGAWDPSLAFVMVGAIGVAFFGFRAARSRATSASGAPIALPRQTGITPSLVLGAVLFGIGWGLVGLCPGPSFAAIGAGHLDVVFFVVALLGGAGLVDLVRHVASVNASRGEDA
ncbi:MAG: YeeE/YedE family protein [Sandaracinaceae bacterium]|nr:YeeE/YedE family protein [Sandaracinaceae bacterium]